MTQSQALAILKTGANVFLTGEPGAGKTHIVNAYAGYLRSREVEPAITASTGIAATHIGGYTIHSWSGIGIIAKFGKYDLDRIASTEHIVKRVGKAKVLVIDEVSMLPPETLNMVEAVCRAVKQSPEPFGGLQIILVGDFFQLPPIVKSTGQESRQAELLSTPVARFAYDSSAWARLKPVVCYLTEQHRQDDPEYLALLSAIRCNGISPGHQRQLAGRAIAEPAAPPGAPKLFSHNVDVDRVNAARLAELPGPNKEFFMEARGPRALVEALKKGCLSPQTLALKIGAAVMFTKNNQREGFVNGTLGTIEGFSQSGYPVVKTRRGRRIEVAPMEWTVQEGGRVRAEISQVPLRLAWAITVHKSQGMSLDEAVMDLSAVFEFGQGYVALSRVRRLSGVHLLGWSERAFMVHPEVLAKDNDFRASSLAAAETFGKLPPGELDQMHKNFIAACGGKNINSKDSARPEKPQPAAVKNIKGAGFDKIRELHPNAYRPWDENQDQELRALFAAGTKVAELTKTFGRKTGAIRSRLVKLELVKPG